eukprot:5652562-Pleurochrysis_carterae.AAC.1
MAGVVPTFHAVLVAGAARAHCACAARAQRPRRARSARVRVARGCPCNTLSHPRAGPRPCRSALRVRRSPCPARLAAAARLRVPPAVQPRAAQRCSCAHGAYTKVPTPSGGLSNAPLDAVHAHRCMHKRCRRRAAGRATHPST